MCLVIIQDELKKSCCNCSGRCKRSQKQVGKMNHINESINGVDRAVLLHNEQPLQYRYALTNTAALYEESNHLRLG